MGRPVSEAEDLDPHLTNYERAALQRLIVSERKGGEGWHHSHHGPIKAILDAGETGSNEEVELLCLALRLDERAQRRRA